MSRRGSVLEGIDFKPMTFEGQQQGATIGIQNRQLLARGDELKQEKEAAKARQRADDDKWVEQYYDPKDRFSGNPLTDPEYGRQMMELRGKGKQLALQGKPKAEIEFALRKEYNNLQNYTNKAKAINNNLTEYTKALPKDAYNQNEVYQRGLRMAFIDPTTGKLRQDFDNIDETRNYGSDAIANAPLETVNGGVVSNFVDGEMKNLKADVRSRSFTNPAGKKVSTKLEVIAPNWMVFDTDANGNQKKELVPDWEIAKNGDEVITHTFIDPTTGKQKLSPDPVRVVTDDLFDYATKTQPGLYDRLMGAVEQYIQKGDYKDANGNPITVNSPQAKTLAKAILYDELKMANKASVKDIQATVMPKNVTNVTVNTGNGGTPVNTVYDNISALYESSDKQLFANRDIEGTGIKKGDKLGIPFNVLNGEMQETILKQFGGRSEYLNEQNTFISRNDKGDLVLYRTTEDGDAQLPIPTKDKAIGVINRVGTDTKAKQAGTKGIKGVIERGEPDKKGKSGLGAYPLNIQNGIKAFMKSNNLSEQDAIKALKEAGKL